MGAHKSGAAHRLFIVYGAIQKIGNLGVHLAAAHVAILGHRHLGVGAGDHPHLLDDARGQFVRATIDLVRGGLQVGRIAAGPVPSKVIQL